MRIGILTTLLFCSVGLSQTDAPPPTQPAAAPFQAQGILPKSETGALRFLEQHPEYDGRGVIVAIFDTGVDPGAPGLQTTSDGQPKIVDLIDATGSGDVDITTEREAADGQIEGLTGRQLKLNSEWKNPSGKYRVGMKVAYDLFPSELIPRLEKEHQKEFTRNVQSLRAQLRDKQTADGKPDELSDEERKARLAVLDQAQDSYKDPGPVYDCVMFHDGEVWRAVVDTNENGDLTDEKLLADYRHEHQYATFSEESRLNFSVRIPESGESLSLVTTSNEHGTHVAGIVAAYDAERPERNGLAPGVQLVSVKIGDPRLGAMETGAALLRGLSAVVEQHCDMINMSFGEPGATPNQGEIVDRCNEVVREKNVIFVSSAGNAGPALSTVGAPGGTSSALLGVGAYVSPAMMEAQYSQFDLDQGLPYTWTSRGPTPDGDWGVDIFAPGGAIAPIPNYALAPGRRMNGTSMASPNACGTIALMLSGLKQLKAPYTQASVRRSVQATAQRIETADDMAQGAGLLQIDKAFEHHQASEMALPRQFGVEVSIPARNESRGIYLRDPDECSRLFEAAVRVEPFFPESAGNQSHLDYEVSIQLEATQDWVTVGRHLMLTSEGGSFPVQVHPEGLKAGLHTAEIRGTAVGHPEWGPLFRVPVIVTKSDAAAKDWQATVKLTKGEIRREFLAVPQGARAAKIRIERKGGDTGRFYFFHTVQLTPGRSHEEREMNSPVSLAGDEVHEATIPVVAGRTLELCLAQYWTSMGDSTLDVEVDFVGLHPSTDQLALPNDGSAVELVVAAESGFATCDPHARLDQWERVIFPKSHDLKLLTAQRDTLWDGLRMSHLILTYEFQQPGNADVYLTCPRLENLLYESPVGSMRMLVFDENQQMVYAEDVFPETAASLKSGKYQVKVELRDVDREKLEGFNAMPLSVRQSVSAVTIPISSTHTGAAGAGDRFNSHSLGQGERTSLFLDFPENASLPGGIEAGDRLTGTLKLTKDDGNPVRLTYTHADADAHQVPDDGADNKASDDVDLDKQQAEFWQKTLKTLDWDKHQEQIQSLLTRLQEQNPDSREPAVLKLQLLDTEEGRKGRLPQVVEAADAVLAKIDQAALQSYFGIRHDPQTDDERKTDKERTAEREDLIDALYRKGRALAYMELDEVIAKHPIDDQAAHDKQFEENFQQLAKWVDTTNKEYFLLHIRRDRRKGEYGQAIQLLNRYVKDEPTRKLFHKKRRDMYEKLGWESLESYEQHTMWRQFPDKPMDF